MMGLGWVLSNPGDPKKDGTLTTRTSDSVGTVTFTTAHPFNLAMKVKVSWTGGMKREGMIVVGGTVAPPYTIVVSGGSGAVLPVATTAVNVDADDGLAQILQEFGGYLMVLPTYADWFAATGGLSTEMQTTLTSLLNGFFEDIPGYAPMLWNPAPPYALGQYLGALAAALAALPANPALGLGPNPFPNVVAAMAALADGAPPVKSFHLLSTDITALDTTPPFAATKIYGEYTKTANQPFSGAGDYNDNGDTNKFVYDATKNPWPGHSGGLVDFLQCASGYNSWYPGSASLPVAGVLGLALLAGACALAAARTFRKK
jgi:hypothetical protein